MHRFQQQTLFFQEAEESAVQLRSLASSGPPDMAHVEGLAGSTDNHSELEKEAHVPTPDRDIEEPGIIARQLHATGHRVCAASEAFPSPHLQ